MNFFQKAKTLFFTPGMTKAWLRWQMRRLGRSPYIELAKGVSVSGFRDFSEYWSVAHMLPALNELRFIEKYAGHSGVILDVGGNVGCMALSISRLRKDLILHVFEPSPETFSSLKINLSNNNLENIRAHELAVGAVCGSVKFHNDIHTPALNRLVSANETGGDDFIEVSVTTLDAFVEEQQIDEVAFLKIDVEGHEQAVIEGATNLLKSRKCRAGLVELCPSNLEMVGRTVSDLIFAVEKSGHDLYFLTEEGEPGDRVTVENGGSRYLTNIAMLPK